ncbi:MAG TPA: hypothetical protein VIO11_00620, partial [Candidatus Methanoperedens sp.]
MGRISRFIKSRSIVFIEILLLIILSGFMVIAGTGAIPAGHAEGNQDCTTCHDFGIGQNQPEKKLISDNKVSGQAYIKSDALVQGGSPDCVSCHDISGTGAPADKRIDASAIKNGVHGNLNNGSTNTTMLSDQVDKACWACHGDGTEPLTGHQSNYATPYSCTDCHNRTANLPYTNSSLIPNLAAVKIYDHVQPPYYESISSTKNSSKADCNGCHDKSKAAYNDPGLSLSANVSHYATRTNLVSPSIKCSLCHKDARNSSAYWANMTRHPAMSAEDSFCRNCHNTTLARDLHDRPLVKASSIHMGFDWQNDDYNEISPLGINEACLSCHSGHATAYVLCEDCHLQNGKGPATILRPDINNTIPRVSAHTNFSTEINVPNQSKVYPPSPSTVTASSCYSFNSTSLAGTCHGISYRNMSISGGYFAFKTGT